MDASRVVGFGPVVGDAGAAATATRTRADVRRCELAARPSDRFGAVGYRPPEATILGTSVTLPTELWDVRALAATEPPAIAAAFGWPAWGALDEHVLVAGDDADDHLDAVLRVGLLRRAAGTARDEFAAHWVDHHTPLVLASGPRFNRYVCSIFRGDTPWDGLLEQRFADVDEMRRHDLDVINDKPAIADDLRSMIADVQILVAHEPRGGSEVATFVLVHGGGHGGWCWQPTASALRADGHEVWTPTLTGFGERAHLDGPHVKFETFVTDVANVLRYEDLRDVVLVGHSMGGVVVPRVAEVEPARIRRVVWLGAIVVGDGERLVDVLPLSPALARAITKGPEGTNLTDAELLLDALIHDGDDGQRAFVRERRMEYPPHALVEPGRLSAFLALGLPTAYVTAAEDRAIEAATSEPFAARLPGAVRRQVPGGHDCMVTQPAALAATLAELAALD